MYGAPETLGLDPNSESSDYTSSVDIWSLGCVVYELLVGTNLFASWDQFARYFRGKRSFPEDILRGLSPPICDVGISLLKSMLLIQPEDRPTAAEALSDVWLMGLTRGGEHKAQYDLVQEYKLDTEFFQDHIRHIIYMGTAESDSGEVGEEWSNCGEIGRGGFSVVYKQIQKTTGQYRAVKTIDKRLPTKLDYSRELVLMARLTKV